MSRNLLPRLRQAPNPANIPPARVGEWTDLSTPGALAQLDFGSPEAHIRTRIQSIPSPWARMLLFKNAFEEDGHPARTLVQSELLDALEFLWSIRARAGRQPDFRTIQVSGIEGLATRQASQRVERFARALLELIPRRSGNSMVPSFESITMMLVDGRPVLATSPYTVLFTCEDAAAVGTGTFFSYAKGGSYRPLSERPVPFQRYIAQVLLPQFGDFQNIGGPNVDGAAVVRLLKPWLDDEVRNAQAARGQHAASLDPPIGGNWEGAAHGLGLSRIRELFHGVSLFARDSGAQLVDSKWILRPNRTGVVTPPLIVDPQTFDGIYFPGASKIELPRDLGARDRQVLPGNGLQYPWVNPSTDWFTDRLLALAEPLDAGNVLGFDVFSTRYDGKSSYLRRPQFTLPLRAEAFRYFTPEEISRRLRIEVQRDGRIVITLAIPVGPEGGTRELVVQRTYDETSVHEATGPSLALWPRFRSDNWRLYTLFRRDLNPNVAAFFELTATAAGERLEYISEQRNEVVRVSSFTSAPEVLEFASSVGAGADAGYLGVVIPKYRQPQAGTRTKLNVGIDFGTSNTVVSVRSDGAQAREIFGVRELTLRLTRGSASDSALVDAYFLPDSMRAAPFGTAVMRFARLPNQNIMSEPVGVRINIPFSGAVQSDDRNAVVGDLKWSANAPQQFLSAAFLRHLLIVIAADAVQEGIDPVNITVSWAHPRAFTQQQVNVMRQLWDQVHESLAERGVTIGPITEAVDESRAVLRHFFNAGKLGPAGQTSAIIDIGGGTSDIAVYGGGRTVLLDSVMLAGRNLTGQRLQGSTPEDFANPFVGCFIRWSHGRQLDDYPVSARAVEKYLADGQDHLAFSYLIQTQWFNAHGRQFSGDDSFQRFQSLVFYFFGALFYYLGLSLRETELVPRLIVLAGNGSQYMHWLTDLVPGAGERTFTDSLGRVLLAGIRNASEQALPEIQLTDRPKHEVALGLVAPVRAEELAEQNAVQESVAGESIRVRLRSPDEEVSMNPVTRLRADSIVQANQAATLAWVGEEMEIERFHQTLLKEIAGFTAHGVHWQTNTAKMRAFLGQVKGTRLQDLTRNRLQYLASLHGGFHGSLFILEASVVLEQMLSQFFSAESSPTELGTGGAAIRGGEA